MAEQLEAWRVHQADVLSQGEPHLGVKPSALEQMDDSLASLASSYRMLAAYYEIKAEPVPVSELDAIGDSLAHSSAMAFLGNVRDSVKSGCPRLAMRILARYEKLPPLRGRLTSVAKVRSPNVTNLSGTECQNCDNATCKTQHNHCKYEQI